MNGGENFFEGVGSVGVINDDVERLADINAIHTAFDGAEGMNTGGDF